MRSRKPLMLNHEDELSLWLRAVRALFFFFGGGSLESRMGARYNIGFFGNVVGDSNLHPEESLPTKELLPYLASTTSPDSRQSAGTRKIGMISCGFERTLSVSSVPEAPQRGRRHMKQGSLELWNRLSNTNSLRRIRLLLRRRLRPDNMMSGHKGHWECCGQLCLKPLEFYLV